MKDRPIFLRPYRTIHPSYITFDEDDIVFVLTKSLSLAESFFRGEFREIRSARERERERDLTNLTKRLVDRSFLLLIILRHSLRSQEPGAVGFQIPQNIVLNFFSRNSNSDFREENQERENERERGF